MMLNIEQPEQITRDPLRNFLVENLVVAELMKFRCNHGLEPNLYFYRDNQKHEVDIIKQANQLIAIEIKSGKTFHKQFLKGLRYIKQLLPERIRSSYLVYDGEQEQIVNEHHFINYQNVSQVYAEPAI